MNMIKTYPFLRMEGQIEPPVEQLDAPIQRRGVDGSGFWKTGKRGPPFRVRTWVDHQSMAVAWTAIKAYRVLVGEDPMAFEINDQEWNNDDWKVVVLAVEVVDWHAVVGGTGGLNPPSGAMLVLDWTLVAVEVEQG